MSAVKRRVTRASAVVKDYDAYCRKCALVKYDLLNQIQLLIPKIGPMEQLDFDNLATINEALDKLDEKTVAHGFTLITQKHEHEMVEEIIES